jgi:ArsR family transcriptional regulator, arsenate/arsenite/antimonite-responsive transcriptional repressor
MNSNALSTTLPVRHKSDPCCSPSAPPSLTREQTAALADRLKAVGDPTRLALLDLLAQQDEPLCVCDLTPRFAQNQPTISHHLRLLREAALIDTEKRGIWAYYWATDEGRRTLASIRPLA